MKTITGIIFLTAVFMFSACKPVQKELTYESPDMKIIFLHHSTGQNVWYGDVKQGQRFSFKEQTCMVPRLLKEYNDQSGRKISIEERAFPSGDPYKWKNYPFDYYNIWVKNAGPKPFMEEPTLEMLTPDYDVIVFKFCFPYSNILADDGQADINSEKKTLANYQLQYEALKEKMHSFPETRFIVWTGAALVENQTNEENAGRAVEMADWVKNTWDEEGDNITIFDFRSIETEGGLYLKPEYAVGPDDSHPNMTLSARAAELFVAELINITEKEFKNL
ncbi:MAG: hypothetical protein ACOYXB_09865 [Bacteroidota bacterium]